MAKSARSRSKEFLLTEPITGRRKEEKDSKIHHPEHYGGDTTYEVIKVIEAWDLNFSLGSVLKYIRRCDKKPGETWLDDLKKAQWYLDREVERVSKMELPG